MTDSLLLHIPYLPSALAEAASAETVFNDIACFSRVAVENDAENDEDSQTGHWQAHTLAKTPTDLKVYVFVPTLHTLCTRVQAPQKQHKHLAQILPFLCEEKLACDLEDVHVVAGLIQGDNIAVKIMHRNLLNTLLQTLAALNIHPLGLYADCDPLLAHTSSGQAALWVEEQRSLWVESQQAISLKSSQAVDLLTRLKMRAPQTLILYRSESAFTDSIHQTAFNLQLEELKNQGTEIIEKTLSKNTELLEAFEQQGIPTHPASNNRAGANTYTNLLTGPYTPATPSSSKVRWQPWALVASILTAINLVYLLGSGLYFNLQAQNYRNDSEQLYKDYFPQDRRIINIQTQTKNHLASKQLGQNNGFLVLLNQFLPSWEQHNNELQLKSLRYNQQREEILMDIESKTIAQLDQLQRSLGNKAELLSVNEDRNKGVRGRLKLQGGR